MPQNPKCPHCHKEIGTIFTSRTVHLNFVDDKWVEEQVDHYFTYQCSECYEELSSEDLDQMDVPNEIR